MFGPCGIPGVHILEVFRLAQRADTVPVPDPVVIPAWGTVMSEDTALSLINVYRAVGILVIAGKQLTIDVWRGRELLPTPSVIVKPDIHSHLSAWIAETVVSLALTGDAYWKITHGTRGPINAKVLDPHTCRINPNGTLNHNGKTLNRGDFQHLKLMRRPGRTYGLGPIQAARSELAGALDLRDYAAEWFTSGDSPSGVLKSDQHLSPAQATQYKTDWAARTKHNVAVLGAGLAYEPVMLKPEDAQFIQSRQFTKTDIATLFGIPARHMLATVEGGSMTYANMSQEDLAFVRWTLMDYLREIEEALTTILPGQQVARFNLDGILRPDTVTRYKAHGLALDKGFMTVDEVRAIEGLPPLNGTPHV